MFPDRLVKLDFCLFVCSFLNDAASNSHYTAKSRRLIIHDELGMQWEAEASLILRQYSDNSVKGLKKTEENYHYNGNFSDWGSKQAPLEYIWEASQLDGTAPWMYERRQIIGFAM